jgi:hypothetical protein
MPDGSAYQYVTATLDLALTGEEHNLLVASDQGELLTTGRLPTPGPLTPRAPARDAKTAKAAAC